MPQVGASFPLKEACELLKSKKHTDFILRCDNHEFATHRVLLYQKSPFFRAALDNDFKEKLECAMIIGETTPEALAATIIYCYSNSLDLTSIKDAWPDYFSHTDCSLNFTALSDQKARDKVLDIYLLSHRLLLPDLAEKATNTFLQSIHVEKNKSTIVALMKDTYNRLPTNDSTLKPFLTAFMMCKGGEKLSTPLFNEVQQVMEQEDRAVFLAIKFCEGRWRLKVGDDDAWKRIFDNR